MIRRVRIIANGSSVIEDIEDYGRVAQIFTFLLPSNRRMGNVGEGWGGSSTVPTFGSTVPQSNIPGDNSRQVGMSFLSPFLNQGKYIPLHMLPLTIELELADADMAFMGGGNEWEITRPRLLASVATLDNALANSYAQHMLQGKSLPFYCDGFYSIKSAVTSTSIWSIPISRGFTRLNAVYVTFFDDSGDWLTNLYHPLGGAINNTNLDTMEWNLTIGASRHPIFSCESTAETYYRLRLCEQTHGGRDAFGITPYEYFQNKFIIGQSLEKAPGSSHTGENTRSGSQLTMNFKNLAAATTCHVILKYEQIVNLSSAGTQVLD